MFTHFFRVGNRLLCPVVQGVIICSVLFGFRAVIKKTIKGTHKSGSVFLRYDIDFMNHRGLCRGSKRLGKLLAHFNPNLIKPLHWDDVTPLFV